MKYKVTYETTTKPTDLPKGAEVEQLPAIPLELNGVGLFGNKRVVIRKAVAGQGVKSSSILIENENNGRLQDVNLTKEQTTEVADAFLEILGLPSTSEIRNADDEIREGDIVRITNRSVFDHRIQVGDKARVLAVDRDSSVTYTIEPLGRFRDGLSFKQYTDAKNIEKVKV